MFTKRDYLKKNVGNTIEIEVKISDVIWQHMTRLVESHPNMIYFELEYGYQIILYCKDEIVCKGKLRITGTVTELISDYNRQNVKISDKFCEYHVIVDSWKCLG